MIFKTTEKIVGCQHKSLDDLYITAGQRKALSIINDETQPLHSEFELHPSGWRYKVPLAKKKIYKVHLSLIINIINN